MVFTDGGGIGPVSPEGWMPALILYWRMYSGDATIGNNGVARSTNAIQVRDAAMNMATQIAHDFSRDGQGVNYVPRTMMRDTGYEIRGTFVQMVMAYDALYDQFVAAGRTADLTLIMNTAQTWVNAYKNDIGGTGYAKGRFTNNVGVHYLAATAMA